MHSVDKIMKRAMVINFLLSIMQVAAGIVGSSSAVVADGIHTLSDFATDLVAVFGNKLAHKRANDKHPYGYGEIEYLTSILIGAVVLGIGMLLIFEIMLKTPTVPSMLVVIVTLISLIAKFVLSQYVLNMGHKHNNAILIASGKESHADVISSIFVLFSALIAQLTKYNSIFIYTDRVTALIVGLFIIKVGYGIMAENISGIIGEQELNPEIQDGIKKVILSEKEIKSISSTILLKYGPYYKLIIDIHMDENILLKKVYKIKRRLVSKLKKYNKKIRYITIDIKDN